MMDTEKYLIALENFICKLQQLPDSDPEQVPEDMAVLCRALRVGKAESVIYENEGTAQQGTFATACFYDGGNSSADDCVSRRVNAADGKTAFYNMYPIKGESEWTQEERNRIDALTAVLSVLNGKSKIVRSIRYMTSHDMELGVYNIKHFMMTASMLCRSRQIFRYTAVRFNLKRFSVVNEHIGRENGTQVMIRFIGLINDVLKDENELTCRVGGDNFLTLVRTENLESVIKILSGTGVAYGEGRGERVLIKTTVGVYHVKDMGGSILPTDVMDRVSIAFKLAKDSPTTDIVYFNDEIFARIKRSNEISAAFPKALEQREFLVYYQPKVALDGRHIAGAEALCRWMHDGRMVSPGEFIPVLEQGLDICKLDFYMLDAVCRDIRKWLDSGRDVVRISVNMSRRHLTEIDLLERIIEIVDRNNVPHKYIELELTETTTDVEFKDLKNIIAGLRQAGIATAVDDFGIGYSSLNLIKELPWDVLKLDRSLLPAEGDENAAQKGVMFRYIVAMAQEMGLECVSEGAETAEQIRLLSEYKCNISQGFYFDRPLPAEEFEKRLDKSFVYER
ncbi:MAG: GGDEF domain-containing protein [Oscillospiraceae bacterium]|nr:GGDEF domain-containing protein [Oscillospiraceae bacterium]